MLENNHEQDVVYGGKDGMGLLMDVYTPRDPRVDAAVIWVAAGGWRTRPELRRNLLSEAGSKVQLPRWLLDAGYVVFAVSHSTQPRYSIDDLRDDIPRAVRFIRHNAARFRIDPGRIGVAGSSSAGHVSLLTAAAPPQIDDPADAVDEESSRVQAAVAYYGPTDLLNYGAEGVTAQTHLNKYFLQTQGHEFNGPFDFSRFDESRSGLEAITNADERHEILRRNSPIQYVNANTPPILMVHGDADPVVPLQQSTTMAASLQQAGVPHKLIVVPDLPHAWPEPPEDGRAEVVDWFGRYLGPERRS